MKQGLREEAFNKKKKKVKTVKIYRVELMNQKDAVITSCFFFLNRPIPLLSLSFSPRKSFFCFHCIIDHLFIFNPFLFQPFLFHPYLSMGRNCPNWFERTLQKWIKRQFGHWFALIFISVRVRNEAVHALIASPPVFYCIHLQPHLITFPPFFLNYFACIKCHFCFSV